MSRLFNTAEDRITQRQMIGFAAVLAYKRRADVSPREAMAAVPAIQSWRRGAPLQRVREIFKQELQQSLYKEQ
jgi:hypothetical protein